MRIYQANQSGLGRSGGRLKRSAVLFAAAVASLGYTHHTDATTFVVSTAGATALGAFDRANNNADNPGAGGATRGVFTVGAASGGTLQIGNTTYTGSNSVTYFGTVNPNSPASGEPTAGQDQVLYYYKENGSVFGLDDLVTSNGLQLTNAGVNLYPGDPNAVLYLWVNGSRFTSPNSSGIGPGNFSPARTLGSNNGSISNGGQPLVQVAWSDVRFEQAFSVGGAPAAYTSRPTTAGYGLGRGSVGSTNFQALASASGVVGGIDPTTTRLRNDTVAVEAFNMVANPGTGLGQITKSDGQWLQLTGRLANGANFNVTTRDIGSGTRNEGDLNLGLDPSWGAGERDRRATSSYDTVDYNGNPVHVNVGDEASPLLSLSGSSQLDQNESRVSPLIHYSDKISGGDGVRATVVAARMALGILGGGDSSSASAGQALSGNASVAGAPNNTTTVPMRALAIDWGNGAGYTQATVQNIASGKYQMWSNSQAITVAPYADPTLNDQTYTTRPVLNDVRDVSGGSITTATTSFAANGDAVDPGLVRKFLDNITNSVVSANPASSQITPADFIMSGGYILPQIMSVTKNFDGDTSYGTLTLTASQQNLYNNYASSPGQVMFDKTNWADPHQTNGALDGSQTYKIFATVNNAVAGEGTATANAVPNRTIAINARDVLAGDYNGDGVRDLQDVPAMALAFANASTYLSTPASGNANGWNYDGTDVNATSTATGPSAGSSNASSADGLIVLSDLNGDGNVTVDSNDKTFATTPMQRADVRFFLYGASVDTSAYNSATITTLNGQAYALTATQNRAENGVRLGQMKKNAAIDTFDSTLDGFVGSVTNPSTGLPYTQSQVDALKFNKFDVNGDGVVNRADAQYVDRNVSTDPAHITNYTTLSDVLGTNDDLVAAELQDNNTITSDITGPGSDGTGSSDFKMIRDALGSQLVDGDADFSGAVGMSDFNALAMNFGTTGQKWSAGDFNFDGVVNALDLNAIATNFGVSASAPLPGGPLGALVPEPGSIGLIMAAFGLTRIGSRSRRRR